MNETIKQTVKENFHSKRIPMYATIFFGLLFFDLLSKAIADCFKPHFAIVKGLLEINITHNTGAAFSFLGDKEWAMTFFIILTLIICSILLVMLFVTPSKKVLFKLSLVFLLSGAMGNFVDRVCLAFVRDFVDFPWFANCNFADFFITAGVVMLFVHLLFTDDEALFKKSHE